MINRINNSNPTFGAQLYLRGSRLNDIPQEMQKQWHAIAKSIAQPEDYISINIGGNYEKRLSHTTATIKMSDDIDNYNLSWGAKNETLEDLNTRVLKFFDKMKKHATWVENNK